MIDGRRNRAEARADGASPFDEGADAGEAGLMGEAGRKGLRGPGKRLVALGVTADQVTVFGILLAAVTGVTIGLGHLWTGVALVTVGGLMDTLDGAVAKAAGSASHRGAFFDSVSDRVADGFIFGGLAWYLAASHHGLLAVLPFAILAVGNVISYERAKAELYGWNAKGGLMERAERLIVLGIALAFNVVLVPLLFVLLALCVFTAGQRFFKIWRQATAELRGDQLPIVVPITAEAAAQALLAWRPARVDSRYRAWREARASGTRTRERLQTSSRRPRSRRLEAPLSTKLRSVLAADRAGT
ncbi:MAG: CDP-alcohol phosphatidyltransferase family protein, partial [Acidimicrobiales bacterium]